MHYVFLLLCTLTVGQLVMSLECDANGPFAEVVGGNLQIHAPKGDYKSNPKNICGFTINAYDPLRIERTSFPDVDSKERLYCILGKTSAACVCRVDRCSDYLSYLLESLFIELHGLPGLVSPTSSIQEDEDEVNRKKNFWKVFQALLATKNENIKNESASPREIYTQVGYLFAPQPEYRIEARAPKRDATEKRELNWMARNALPLLGGCILVLLLAAGIALLVLCAPIIKQSIKKKQMEKDQVKKQFIPRKSKETTDSVRDDKPDTREIHTIPTATSLAQAA